MLTSVDALFVEQLQRAVSRAAGTVGGQIASRRRPSRMAPRDAGLGLGMNEYANVFVATAAEIADRPKTGDGQQRRAALE